MGIEKLKEFKILSEMGRGGTGVVYRAKHKQSGQAVALKVVHEHLLQPDASGEKAQFVRDVMGNCKLDHPNIGLLHTSLIDQGNLVIATELLDGDTLDAILESPVELSVELRLDWLLQIVTGISFAHQAGIVHGDLKPSNLFVTKENQVKILDMGLRRELAPDARPFEAAQSSGSPAYLAPETYRLNNKLSVRDVGKKGDIFTVGVIAYRLLNGCLPYGLNEKMSATDIYTRLVVNYNAGEPIPRMNSVRNGVPVEVADAVMDCLTLLPQKRPPNVEWLAAVVLNVRREPLHRRSLEGLATYFSKFQRYRKAPSKRPSAPPLSHPAIGDSTTPPQPARRRRSPVTVILFLLFAMIGAATGVVYFRPDLVDLAMAKRGCESNRGIVCDVLAELRKYAGGADSESLESNQDEIIDACVRNDGGACWVLGDRFENAKNGVRQDTAKATEYYQRACELDDPAGCGSLGKLYALGKGGLPQDAMRAVPLFEKACDQGDMPACVDLGDMHRAGKGGLSKSDARAVALYTRACDARDMNGCVQLGQMHELGAGGLTLNTRTAVTLYEMACEKDNATGCQHLGDMYARGQGVDRDLIKAGSAKQKACDLGLKSACIPN